LRRQKRLHLDLYRSKLAAQPRDADPRAAHVYDPNFPSPTAPLSFWHGDGVVAPSAPTSSMKVALPAKRQSPCASWSTVHDRSCTAVGITDGQADLRKLFPVDDEIMRRVGLEVIEVTGAAETVTCVIGAWPPANKVVMYTHEWNGELVHEEAFGFGPGLPMAELVSDLEERLRSDARAIGAQFEIFEIPAPFGRAQFEEVVAARRAATER
jgi:hypothetical protein